MRALDICSCRYLLLLINRVNASLDRMNTSCYSVSQAFITSPEFFFFFWSHKRLRTPHFVHDVYQSTLSTLLVLCLAQ